MNRAHRQRLLVAALLSATLTMHGCTSMNRVLGFKDQVAAADATVRISGKIDTEGPVQGNLIIIVASPAYAEDGSPMQNEDGSPAHLGVDSYSRANPGTFLFILAPGKYRIGAYEDRNKNGTLDPGERVTPLRGAELYDLAPGGQASVEVLLGNDSVWDAEPLDLLGLVEKDAREQGQFALGAFSAKGKLAGELSDPRFGQEQGPFGLWQPMDFLNQELAGIYFLEPYDPDRVPVLYVHGISGYPQEFEKLIGGLDRSRFQPWFYFYPSGFSLDGIAGHLSDLLREMQIRHRFDEIAIVAHSMGGLVSRAAILKYSEDTQRDDIEIFITINSPFGGDVKAKRAEGAPIAMPDSFKDMSPSSEFMTWVFYEDEEREVFKPLPRPAVHHMIMGFNGSGSPCNDGSVSCESQSMPDLQERAASVRNWNYTHVGTLHEQRTVGRVNRLLEEHF
jgi:pimeloyl-ACP methyl ester carboxylesterase